MTVITKPKPDRKRKQRDVVEDPKKKSKVDTDSETEYKVCTWLRLHLFFVINMHGIV